ncbi:MAG: hypothetical protein ACHP65_01370 [Legionellales bacterium]
MNHSLTALMTKLTWQKNELDLHLQAAQMQALQVQQELQKLEHESQQLCVAPLIINPEFEINRLNFTSQQQEKKNQLSMVLKDHSAVEQKLTDKLQRVHTELKMLEKYLHREEQVAKREQQKIQEHAMDEFGLRKELYEKSLVTSPSEAL